MKLLCLLLLLPAAVLGQTASTGASGISTKNPAYAHAVPQTVERKLGELNYVTDWGAKYDGLLDVLTTNAGSTTITKQTGDPNPFTAADVGKLLEVPGAGGSGDPLRISAVNVQGYLTTSTMTPIPYSVITTQGAVGVSDAYLTVGMFCQGANTEVVTWQIDGSNDPTFATGVSVVYTNTVYPIVAGVSTSLNNRDTYRVYAPPYLYYRVEAKDAVSGNHAHGLYMLNVHSHILSGTITAVIDPADVTLSVAATHTISNIGTYPGAYGTDNHGPIQNAINDVCKWNGSYCTYPGTLYFPHDTIQGSLGYLVKGSLYSDGLSLIGYHSQITWAQSTVPTTTTALGAAGTTPLVGAQPVLFQNGDIGATSFQTYMEGLELNANAIPSSVYFTPSSEEDSGTRHVGIGGYNGELGGRAILIVGSGSQNSAYEGGNITDFLGTMIPPPPMYLTSAITTPSGTAQTFNVNRTDWMTTGTWVEWIHAHDASQVQLTVIDANCTTGSCRVSGIVPLQTHAVNDPLMLSAQPVGIDVVNVASKVMFRNMTVITSPIPGWGECFRNYYSNVEINGFHAESCNDGIENYGQGTADTITGLSNVNVMVSSFGGGYSNFKATNINAGAPAASFNYYDASNNEFLSSYNIGEYQVNSTGNIELGASNGGYLTGYRDMYHHFIASNQYGVQIQRLLLGSEVNTGTTTPVPLSYGHFPGFGWGGCGGGACSLWSQGGTNGGVVQMFHSYDFGVTFPTTALTMDVGNGGSSGVPLFHIPLFACGDGGSSFYPHASSVAIPTCLIGNQYSVGQFAIQHTGTSASELDFLGCNNSGFVCGLTSAGAFVNPSAWTKYISIDALANTVTINGVNPIPSIYGQPLGVSPSTGHPWIGFAPGDIATYIANQSLLEASVWIHNTACSGYSQLTWENDMAVTWNIGVGNSCTGTYLQNKFFLSSPSGIPMWGDSTAMNFAGIIVPGNFTGGTVTYPKLAGDDGTGIVPIDLADALGLNGAGTGSPVPFAWDGTNYSLFDVPALAGLMGLTSGLATSKMVVWNGVNYNVATIPTSPTPAPCAGPESNSSGTSWTCTTPTQMATALTSTAVASGHTIIASSGQYIDAGGVPLILWGGTAPITSSSAGAENNYYVDTSYFYLYKFGSWRRTAISTF